MGLFVFLPLVLPLTAWPIARLAEQHLHPRRATRLLAWLSAVMAVCSTLSLALIMVVGTAQLPHNPLPDGWSDPEVREAVPYDEVAGAAAIPALTTVTVLGTATLWRHHRVRRRAARALDHLPRRPVAVVRDVRPYAYALPGRPDRVVASTGMLARLDSAERRALFAHERVHLTARHHRYLLTTRLAARTNPFLRPLHHAVAFGAERWADEEAARLLGDRRLMARAVGKAALAGPRSPGPTIAALAAPGPVPRRIAALLEPPPAPAAWPALWTATGLAAWTAAAGTTVSALASANSAFALITLLHAATPL
ncbi:M56 family metallopeptidase [Streptomyces chumphonensis]|uniref:M56 family metallopeptidase n=1 Tax=Streptomyces chumphonensis TaxID=1214925 RepID=A0A927EXU8_9ACTN|nr:M56 family metallopeptidase [Streptomyces chumphonensis]MBD3931975.1 M56 family metallopeptidase [Streptomyces chumphonensis]